MRLKEDTTIFLSVLLCFITFILGFSICIMVLSHSELLKRTGQDTYMAVHISQNISEEHKIEEGIDNLLFDENWEEVLNYQEAKYQIKIVDNVLTSLRLSDNVILCSWELTT